MSLDSSLHISTQLDIYFPIEVDWKAFRDIKTIWDWFKDNPGFRCSKFERCQKDLADSLAKKERQCGWDYIGYTFPLFLP